MLVLDIYLVRRRYALHHLQVMMISMLFYQ
jgi:hypothetical protein